MPAQQHHRGPQHEAVPADRAVQRAHHHEQSLHGPGQPRYARRRLVMAAFSAAPPKEARYEPDGNFQKPGVWKHPHF